MRSLREADVIERCKDAANGHTWITREEHADRSELGGRADDASVECRRLHTGPEVRLHVLVVGRGLLPVVSEAEIDGQVGP